MKRIYNSLLLVAALVCSIMISPSAQAQSAEPVASTAGSSDTGRPNRRHGDVQNIGNRIVTGNSMGLPFAMDAMKAIASSDRSTQEMG